MARARKEGYRSGLEVAISAELKAQNVVFEYEPLDKKIEYLQPPTKRRYTPDFVLANGIIIETKGRFTSADRQKHLRIKEQHPELDIRFVFSDANAKLTKVSPTSYGMWCTKYGFQFAHRHIPKDWLCEKPRGYLLSGKEVDDSRNIRFNPTTGRCSYNSRKSTS
jgi:hypothetical protein